MEETTNFQFIWAQWISPLVDDLYSQLDDEFKNYCNVKIRNLDKICIKAEKFYLRKREEVKRIFYGEYHKGESAIRHRMDFHKIGAIICRTLIEYKVYDFNSIFCKEYVNRNISIYNTDWVVRNALINFRLAVYGSVVFLYHAMQFEYFKSDKLLYNKLCQKGRLDLYNVNEYNEKAKESFENCIVLDLAKQDIGSQSFDYFMYAIILYQLEEHNKNLLYYS